VLVVVASARPDFDFEVDEPALLLPRGVTLCAVELVHVRPLVPDDAPRTLGMTRTDIRRAHEPLFAWEIERPRPLEPRKVRGRLGFYRLDRSVVIPA
jgi:hypothetical protein